MIYQYRERSYRRRRRRAHLLRKIFFLFVVSIVGFKTVSYGVSLLKVDETKQAPKIALSPGVKVLPKSISSGLEKVVNEALDGTKGKYAVAIKNLKTKETFFKHEDRVFEAASLYKLWILLTAMDQLERGALSEDQVLKSKAEELNEKFKISSDSAEMSEGEIEMSVSTAINRMITISHNYAALLLSSKVRLANVRSQMAEYGLNQSLLNPPRTTASDILKFYELLYEGKLVSRERSEMMLDILKKQELNDRIPLYLPEDVDSAHKTGELGPFKHDAGIVFSEKGDYIIVLLSETSDPRAAADREARVSEAVFEYFQNK